MASTGGRGGARRKGRSSRGGRGGQTTRHYPRTARLNTLLQQIVASHLERVDDDRLGFLTVTGVEVDNDLNRAEVFISALGVGTDADPDPEADAAYLAALAEYRIPLQAEIAAQARLRKTPEVVFAFDPGVRAGARIEEILSGLDLPPDEPAVPEDPSVDDPADIAAEIAAGPAADVAAADAAETAEAGEEDRVDG